ncbi:hypothetical protein [Serratia ureilytica]|uniref:Secreted protein n=1 Tax=Serratia ureilytica TaxID=300181 RepID=A0A9X9BZ58_9GAMM|nr:hypothetical protein [Serratia ureilytica]TXE22832.1 hypothetical protein FOT63_24800 [Serratia ureilytica]
MNRKKLLLINGLLVAAVGGMTACAAVSFTHANGAEGESITNTEVQPGNTVILTYPNGTACIDTRSREGRTCQQMAQPGSASSVASAPQHLSADGVTQEDIQ